MGGMFHTLRMIAIGLGRIAAAMEEENCISVEGGAAQHEVIRRATEIQRAVLDEAEQYHKDQRKHMAACERRYLARMAGQDESDSVKH